MFLTEECPLEKLAGLQRAYLMDYDVYRRRYYAVTKLMYQPFRYNWTQIMFLTILVLNQQHMDVMVDRPDFWEACESGAFQSVKKLMCSGKDNTLNTLLSFANRYPKAFQAVESLTLITDTRYDPSIDLYNWSKELGKQSRWPKLRYLMLGKIKDSASNSTRIFLTFPNLNAYDSTNKGN